jgi:hypothetical protein
MDKTDLSLLLSALGAAISLLSFLITLGLGTHVAVGLATGITVYAAKTWLP